MRWGPGPGGEAAFPEEAERAEARDTRPSTARRTPEKKRSSSTTQRSARDSAMAGAHWRGAEPAGEGKVAGHAHFLFRAGGGRSAEGGKAERCRHFVALGNPRRAGTLVTKVYHLFKQKRIMALIDANSYTEK